MHPAWSYPWHHLPCQWGSHREKGRPDIFKGPHLPLIFLLSLICNPCSPLAYKRESKAPHQGDRFNTLRIRSHILKQQPSAQHPFDLSIRDLGHFPLSPVCNPNYELFGANNTSSSHKLDVGSFCPNQYKPSVFLAHHSGQTRNKTNLLVGVYSKHRQLARQVGDLCAF